ncbi:hypothetical protein BGZ63DRAFT_428094 [Mariannaea sp. PMI_226]|nr:hypothetical protein BGZ63DRAFT_428094 [Mariannaea sp. PMI_226]
MPSSATLQDGSCPANTKEQTKTEVLERYLHNPEYYQARFARLSLGIVESSTSDTSTSVSKLPERVKRVSEDIEQFDKAFPK